MSNDNLMMADEALTAVGEKLSDAGAAIWESVPTEGVLAEPLGAVAAKIESGGEYLASHGMNDIASDIAALVRKYPLQTLSLGLALGVIVGGVLWNRSR